MKNALAQQSSRQNRITQTVIVQIWQENLNESPPALVSNLSILRFVAHSTTSHDSTLRTLVTVGFPSTFPEALSASLLLTLPTFFDDFARFSWNLNAIKPRMTAIQYMLYEMTEPYVAEFCQPKSALKIPHPPP